MKIHVLQHEPFEGPGLIQDWATEHGYPITITEVYKSAPLPAMDSFDWLVIMGGGMSVNDEEKYNWLKPEKRFVLEAIKAGKFVLGICFGCQMIANVLGKDVYKNQVKEIGWYPIELIGASKKSGILSLAWEYQTFFHWHGETFDMPEGAIHLAYSEGCRNQAFSIGDKIFGFQFHPETNTQTLNQMVSAGKAELVRDRYVMEANDILSQQEPLLETRPIFFEWLDQRVGAAVTTK